MPWRIGMGGLARYVGSLFLRSCPRKFAWIVAGRTATDSHTVDARLGNLARGRTRVGTTSLTGRRTGAARYQANLSPRPPQRWSSRIAGATQEVELGPRVPRLLGRLRLGRLASGLKVYYAQFSSCAGEESSLRIEGVPVPCLPRRAVL
jgi:hypothetical protein